MLLVSSLFMCLLSFNGNSQNLPSLNPSLEPPVVHRVFFQFVESYEGGGKSRFTGCVTPGGSCYMPSPDIVQDCWNVGDEVWEQCGFVY